MSLDTALKTMAIGDILAQYPQTASVFESFGLHLYAKSQTAKHENLEASALVHAIDLDRLLNQLVQAIEHNN